MGRPRKNPEVKDPDIERIKNLVIDAFNYANRAIDPADYLGAQYAERFGYCKHALELIGEELGVIT